MSFNRRAKLVSCPDPVRCFSVGLFLLTALVSIVQTLRAGEPGSSIAPGDRLLDNPSVHLNSMNKRGEGRPHQIKSLFRKTLRNAIPRNRARTLVKQLGANTFKKRRDAQNILETMGPALIPFLRKKLRQNQNTPERKFRLLKAMRRLRNRYPSRQVFRSYRLANLLLLTEATERDQVVPRLVDVCRNGGNRAGFMYLYRSQIAPEDTLRKAAQTRKEITSTLRKMYPTNPGNRVKNWHPSGPSIKLGKKAKDREKNKNLAHLQNLFAKNKSNSNRQRNDPPGADYFLDKSNLSFTTDGEREPGTIRIIVPGNLWVDIDSTKNYRITGDVERVIFRVSGNLYITDDLKQAENAPLPIFLIGKRKDGSGGDIRPGDPAYGTLETFSGVAVAAGNLKFNELTESFQWKGLLFAGSEGKISSRSKPLLQIVPDFTIADPEQNPFTNP